MKYTNVGIAGLIIIGAMFVAFFYRNPQTTPDDLEFITTTRVDSIRTVDSNNIKIYTRDYLVDVSLTRFVRFKSKLDTTVTVTDSVGTKILETQSLSKLSPQVQTLITDIIVQK